MTVLKAGRTDAAAVHGESQCPHFFFLTKNAYIAMRTLVLYMYVHAYVWVEHAFFSPGLGFRNPGS